ncbi:COG4227 Antirestriction protein [uncultured Caudovirales phage]|uniref:COG4227 Antirestriction protein n=1 Tax=uncultured Caudovirales phage TaxID=2100421 RepID=A0A6J5RF15_9CAUD|nr:COG4227 Antirestriction protein [uncultured Caudovirales phage]
MLDTSAITNKIVERLKAGVSGNFIMPWNQSSGMPVNSTTGASYTGINTLILWCESMDKGYASNTWATYKQWQSIECQVKKGSESTRCYKYGTGTKEVDGVEKGYKYLKPFCLFNAEQVDGYTQPEQAIIANLDTVDGYIAATGAIIGTSNRACYIPSADKIEMPPMNSFRTQDGYYSVLLHELTHWTGATSRLNRDIKNKFGDHGYAFEELVAELGAAFLCAQLGVTNDIREDHIQYLASWIKVLESDTTAIFKAAALANKAAEYLISFSHQESIAA